jgi:hypothetical protein
VYLAHLWDVLKTSSIYVCRNWFSHKLARRHMPLNRSMCQERFFFERTMYRESLACHKRDKDPLKFFKLPQRER